MDRRKTAACRKLFEPAGVRYQFFCDLSGALVCTTALQREDDPERAWNSEGKANFNHCRRCGRWVSDPMYNVETLECVRCSPWEETPCYCPHCGERVQEGDTFCPKCSNRLKYGSAEAATV